MYIVPFDHGFEHFASLFGAVLQQPKVAIIISAKTSSSSATVAAASSSSSITSSGQIGWLRQRSVGLIHTNQGQSNFFPTGRTINFQNNGVSFLIGPQNIFYLFYPVWCQLTDMGQTTVLGIRSLSRFLFQTKFDKSSVRFHATDVASHDSSRLQSTVAVAPAAAESVLAISVVSTIVISITVTATSSWSILMIVVISIMILIIIVWI